MIKTDVNELAERIIQNRRFRNDFYNRTFQNNYNYEDVDGVLTSDMLSRLIQKAKSNSKVESIMSELLDFADSETISKMV